MLPRIPAPRYSIACLSGKTEATRLKITISSLCYKGLVAAHLRRARITSLTRLQAQPFRTESSHGQRALFETARARARPMQSRLPYCAIRTKTQGRSLPRRAANRHDLNEVTVFDVEQNPANEPRGHTLTIGIQLHRLAPIVQLSELVYVLLGL